MMIIKQIVYFLRITQHKTMKLYYFNPNGYGQQAFVCAESKELAIEALKNHKIDDNEMCKEFMISTIDEMVNCKD